MSRRSLAVTITIHREGNPESQLFRLPAWQFKTLTVGSVVFVALVIIAAILYTPIARFAARVPGLNREIARLTSENEQVLQLAATLEELEARYEQVRTALGAEIIAEVGAAVDDQGRERLPVARPIVARAPGAEPQYGLAGPALPVYWPIDSLLHGVVTRGFSPGGPGLEAHPGTDIAVPRGTLIRAAGGGTVAEAGFDAEYGLFVLIDHPGGYRTMYGHASRLLVTSGSEVDAGAVIALSGTTGRSTAPHLHFEKRRGDVPVDPRARIQEEASDGEEGREQQGSR
ncbi:MAG: M23 family metallopeptidase [Gemmatimonadetes bacterium]|nr:M23 family metallopeptidase [Gemmatimonadota bacterium]